MHQGVPVAVVVPYEEYATAFADISPGKRPRSPPSRMRWLPVYSGNKFPLSVHGVNILG